MRGLLLAVVALAVLASADHKKTTKQRETLDLFFKSLDTRWRFDEAVRKMGIRVDAGMEVLRPPWLKPSLIEATNRVAEDNFEKLIETIRKLIETVAEPLKIENLNFSRSDSSLNAKGSVRDAAIVHLSTFKVDDLKLDFFTVSAKLKISFDKVDAHGLYDIDATASGQLHVFGDGHFDVRLYEPSVEVEVRLGYNDEHFSVENLSIYLKLAKLKVIMTEFLGGGEVGDLVCGIISDVGPDFLDEYRQEVNTLLSSELKDTANALLAKVDINTIIDWISGGGSAGDGGDDDDDDD